MIRPYTTRRKEADESRPTRSEAKPSEARSPSASDDHRAGFAQRAEGERRPSGKFRAASRRRAKTIGQVSRSEPKASEDHRASFAQRAEGERRPSGWRSRAKARERRGG